MFFKSLECVSRNVCVLENIKGCSESIGEENCYINCFLNSIRLKQ